MECLIPESTNLKWFAESFVENSLAETSKRQYSNTARKFTLFCKQQGLEDKLALSAPMVELFVTKLAMEGSSAGSIRSSLSALRYYCRRNDWPIAFDSERLKLLLRGIERSKRGNGTGSLHVSISQLRKLLNATYRVADSDEAARLRACFTLAFFGLLRPSEFSVTATTPEHQLRREQVKLLKSSLRLTFRSYKAMSSSSPVTISLVQMVQLPVIDPWVAMYDYLSRFPLDPEARLFDLSCSKLSSWLKRCCEEAGIIDRLTLHSFRRGGATWLAQQGLSEIQLKFRGRWSSNAYMRYIRE